MGSKGKRNIRHLSRIDPTTEQASALAEVLARNDQPIVTAVLGQALIEYDLEQLLRRILKRQDSVTWGRMTSEYGPYGTFAQKITAGYALGLYGEAVYQNLNIVRNIRNAFAHAKFLLDFDHADVISELKEVSAPDAQHSKLARAVKSIRSRKRGARRAYIELCFALSNEILRRDLRRVRARDRNYQRSRAKKSNPFAAALLSSSPGLLATAPQPAGAAQSGGPIVQAPGLLSLESMREFLPAPRDK